MQYQIVSFQIAPKTTNLTFKIKTKTDDKVVMNNEANKRMQINLQEIEIKIGHQN